MTCTRLPPVGAPSQRGRFHGWEKVHDAAGRGCAEPWSYLASRWGQSGGTEGGLSSDPQRVAQAKRASLQCLGLCRWSIAAVGVSSWLLRALTWQTKRARAPTEFFKRCLKNFRLQLTMLMVSYLISAAVAIQFLHFTKNTIRKCLSLLGKLWQTLVPASVIMVWMGLQWRLFREAQPETAKMWRPTRTFIKTLVLSTKRGSWGSQLFCLSSCENCKTPFCTDFDRPTSVRNKGIYYGSGSDGWKRFKKLWQAFVHYLPKRGWIILPGLMCQKFACTTVQLF